MYVVDTKRFKQTLKNRGYGSIGELAEGLKIHRNTIHYYLSGHGVFPENFEKIIQALELKPHEILMEKSDEQLLSLEKIAPLVDNLHSEFPEATFILFGSRSKGTAGKYSDWDIGVTSKGKLSHETYRKIVRRKDELIEDLPYFVDLVNIDRADENFLKEISKHWLFLTGKFNDWIEIQRKAAA
jgi:predicted nucleotidyltransferase